MKNRDADIARRLAAGETLKSIGDIYDLTRERVRQIAADAGVKAQPRWPARVAERRSVFEQLIVEEALTLSHVSRALSLKRSAALAYAVKHFPDLHAASKANANRLASERMTARNADNSKK